MEFGGGIYLYIHAPNFLANFSNPDSTLVGLLANFLSATILGVGAFSMSSIVRLLPFFFFFVVVVVDD